ncbi:hypothetical protein BD408DRAFT_410987 [Parasitella parasitica]|nr:hypothetical protein BD408DRAFT_410987 [Parasitella parasitica]
MSMSKSAFSEYVDAAAAVVFFSLSTASSMPLAFVFVGNCSLNADLSSPCFSSSLSISMSSSSTSMLALQM